MGLFLFGIKHVLFGIKQHNCRKVKTKRINQAILIAKVCISMHKKPTKPPQKTRLLFIVHDIWKSAQAPKCLIVKSLKTKIAHTVTKGKRHSAGRICEKEKKSYKDVWMREWEEYCNDGWMFLNKRPTMMCLAKIKNKIKTTTTVV